MILLIFASIKNFMNDRNTCIINSLALMHIQEINSFVRSDNDSGFDWIQFFKEVDYEINQQMTKNQLKNDKAWKKNKIDNNRFCLLVMNIGKVSSLEILILGQYTLH